MITFIICGAIIATAIFIFIAKVKNAINAKIYGRMHYVKTLIWHLVDYVDKLDSMDDMPDDEWCKEAYEDLLKRIEQLEREMDDEIQKNSK